jgi:hypothetical protein
MSLPLLLHNMSTPPRTQVESIQHGVHGIPVVFSLRVFLQRNEPELPLSIRQRLIDVGMLGLSDEELQLAFDSDPATAGFELDLEGEAPLQGVLVGWRPGSESDSESDHDAEPRSSMELRHCTDPALTARVLARCESYLYLGHREACGDLRTLLGLEVAFDDPRVARLKHLGPLPRGNNWPYDKDDVLNWHLGATGSGSTDDYRRKAQAASAKKRKAAAAKKRPAAKARPKQVKAKPSRGGKTGKSKQRPALSTKTPDTAKRSHRTKGTP